LFGYDCGKGRFIIRGKKKNFSQLRELRRQCCGFSMPRVKESSAPENVIWQA